jgi:signal transduction histidine kinase/ActR/RegA family two-component response regulator
MKVKSKLAMIAILPLVIALAVSIMLFTTSREIEQIDRSAQMACFMTRGISDLNLATSDCLIKLDAQSEAQWHLKCAALERLLTEPALGSSFDKAGLSSVGDSLKRIKSTFAEFVALRQNKAGGAIETEEDLMRKLTHESQILLDSTLSFENDCRTRASDVNNNARKAIAVSTILFAIILVILSTVLITGVSKAISRLQEAMNAVAGGDLDREMIPGNAGELDGLVAAFNEMRTQLKNSQIALQRECEQHRRTEASLKESNVRLSDLLVKLKRAQEQAIEQERMQALRQIANGIVHDFNSSLTPVLGTTEYLLSTPKALTNNAELTDSIKLIDEAARSAKSLVKNLSEFFRPTTSELSDLLDVNDVILESVTLTKPKWKEQSEAEGITITMITDLQRSPPTIHGNRIELQEALTNLILNAIDAMPGGGTISLRTRTEDGQSVMEISDNGEGMMPEVRTRCFEPFFSTKGPASSGMGLAVTKSIVARHKGTLTLDSEQGKGTTFTIRLPVQTTTPARKGPPTAAPKPVSGISVLVVDDEFWSRRIVERYLNYDQCNAVLAADGHDAMAKLAVVKFDLVILDRAMPDMSGDELAIEVKKSHPMMPVIMLTGFGAIMEERGEHPKDVDFIVSKPFTRNELRAAIATVMKGSGGKAAPPSGA